MKRSKLLLITIFTAGAAYMAQFAILSVLVPNEEQAQVQLHPVAQAQGDLVTSILAML